MELATLDVLTKKCNECGIDKLFSAFHKHSGGKFGLRGKCIECKNSQTRSYYKSINKESHAEKAREYLSSNPEARKRARQRNQEWRKNNLAYDAFRRSMRRDAVKRATPAWADKEHIKLVYQKANEYGFHVDHIVPIKSDIVCGLNVPANMQLLDAQLNCGKGNRYWPDMPERSL